MTFCGADHVPMLLNLHPPLDVPLHHGQEQPCLVAMDYNSIHGPGISNFSSSSPRQSPLAVLHILTDYSQTECPRSLQHRLYRISMRRRRDAFPRV